MKSVFYKTGYQFQTVSPFSIQTDITPDEAIDDGNFIRLDTDGTLHIGAGYAWDGASGPVVQTRDSIRASLIHDAFYQLMRGDYLDCEIWRERCDNMLRTILLEDEMSHPRAEAWYLAVRAFGNPSADPAIEHEILQAPRDE